ncbi:MAG: helix-turn-helix transcriptional regulator [Dysosmobacter sp.]|nr:helix-turn-helix transcriptional regulator [Dysosmobacter sp.]
MELKEKLVTLRKEKGLTQLAVAEKLDISRQAISRWESGTALPSTDNLKCLSILYEVPVDYLLKEDSERKSGVPIDELSLGKIKHKDKMVIAIIAMVLIGIISVGVFGYFLTHNNKTIIDIADTKSDKWNESQTEIEIDW